MPLDAQQRPFEAQQTPFHARQTSFLLIHVLFLLLQEVFLLMQTPFDVLQRQFFLIHGSFDAAQHTKLKVSPNGQAVWQSKCLPFERGDRSVNEPWLGQETGHNSVRP